MAKKTEVQISDIKKWTNDYLKWYKKRYHIDTPVFPGSSYDFQNRHTMMVLESIFNHMADDLANDKPFAEKSREYYDKFVTPED